MAERYGRVISLGETCPTDGYLDGLVDETGVHVVTAPIAGTSVEPRDRAQERCTASPLSSGGPGGPGKPHPEAWAVDFWQGQA